MAGDGTLHLVMDVGVYPVLRSSNGILAWEAREGKSE